MTLSRQRISLLVTAIVFTWLSNSADAAECEKPTKLRFSLIPQGNVQRDVAELQPLLDELRATLRIPVEIYIPHSYGAVIEGLASGAIHIARLGPASFVAANRIDPQVTAFASYAHKANAFTPAGAFYFSMLVVRASSEFRDIDSLRGKRLLLVDPDSTSGALIPKYAFAKTLGVPLDAHFGHIGYTGSHNQSVNKVLQGQADAAFVGSTNLAAAIEDSGKAKEVRVIWRSDPIPRDPFVFRGQLCDFYKQQIANVFLGRESERTARLLTNLDATRFVPVSNENYQTLREMN
jgi:phosphonate transport system substrate-binding protein